MDSAADQASHLRNVPLFPLPNVVLLPRAVLPLHIFEPRYRLMMADALEGDRLIAMALLQGSCSESYHGTPPIYDIVGLGRIIAHERLPDGRYNLLLEGLHRARIIKEDRSLTYRRADLQILECTHAFDMDLACERESLSWIVKAPPLATTTLGRELALILAGPISTVEAADLFAFHLIDDIFLKQHLLADVDSIHRVRLITKAIRAVYAPAADLSDAAARN